MTGSRNNPGFRLMILPLSAMLLGACNLFSTTPTTYEIALGDLDGGGDLDAFFANGQSEGLQPNAVWLNQGGGGFLDSGRDLGMADTHQVALGDLDGDGDLDAVEGGWGLSYINNGHAAFSTQNLGNAPVAGSYTRHVSLGDLDQDGDLDMFLAGCCGAFSGDQDNPWVVLPASTIEINDGSGRFNSTSTLSNQACPAGALGDLDGDGDQDAFLACWSVIEHADLGANDPEIFGEDVQTYAGPHTTRDRAPNRVYFNDGAGNLLDSGQSLGNASSFAVALGDLDADHDLDALVGNMDSLEIWLNQGGTPGQFALSKQRIASRPIYKAQLGDVDGDGDLDALLNVSSRRDYEPQLWLNDGQARFTRHKQNLQMDAMQAYTLGDVDNDGDLDVFAGSFDRGYGIWFNDGKGNYARKK